MCTHEGVILWDMVTELASLELLLHLHTREDIVWDGLEDTTMKKKGVEMPHIFHPIELCAMSETNIFNARESIKVARDDFLCSIWEEGLSSSRTSYCTSGNRLE